MRSHAKKICTAPASPYSSQSRVQRFPRRHHRQPLHSVGLQQRRRRSRRLSPDLASRSGRKRRRASGRRRARRRPPRSALPRSHSGGRWTLGPSIGSMAALTGMACRWMRPPFPSCSSICSAAESPRCFSDCERWWPHGAQSRGLHRRERPRYAAGPMGRRWWVLTIYPSGRNFFLTRCSRYCAIMGESQPAEFLRQMADTWNDNIERWTYAVNTDLARPDRRRRLLCPHHAA